MPYALAPLVCALFRRPSNHIFVRRSSLLTRATKQASRSIHNVSCAPTQNLRQGAMGASTARSPSCATLRLPLGINSICGLGSAWRCINPASRNTSCARCRRWADLVRSHSEYSRGGFVGIGAAIGSWVNSSTSPTCCPVLNASICRFSIGGLGFLGICCALPLSLLRHCTIIAHSAAEVKHNLHPFHSPHPV